MARKGFRPARRHGELSVRDYPASLGANQTIRLYDPLVIDSTGAVAPATANAAGTGNLPGIGVAVGILTTAGRPLAHNGNTGQVIASGGTGRVLVMDDPNATFIVNLEASGSQADIIGANVDVTAGAPNSVQLHSTYGIKVAASADIELLFKAVALAPTDELSGKRNGYGADNEIEVRWNNHLHIGKNLGV